MLISKNLLIKTAEDNNMELKSCNWNTCTGDAEHYHKDEVFKWRAVFYHEVRELLLWTQEQRKTRAGLGIFELNLRNWEERLEKMVDEG